MDGVLLLQTKATSLAKEAKKQLEKPILKTPDPSLAVELSTSERWVI